MPNAYIISQIDRHCQNDLEISENKDIIKKLAGIKYKDILRDTLGEYQRRGNFIRIYPARNSDYYDNFFSQQRVYNKYLYRMLYTSEIVPIKNREPPKLNFKMELPPQSYEGFKNQLNQQAFQQFQKRESEKIDDQLEKLDQNIKQENPYAQKEIQNKSIQRAISSAHPKTRGLNVNNLAHSESVKMKEDQSKTDEKRDQNLDKVLITGDDILIEYVDRIALGLKYISEQQLKVSWKQQIEKFINHYVWNYQDKVNVSNGVKQQLFSRLENRVLEMKERRQKLYKLQQKKQGIVNEIENNFNKMMKKKQQIIKKFSNKQLENLLKTSTRNVAQEIVQCLIQNTNQPGLLVEMDSIHQFMNRNILSNEGTENSMANAETEDDDLSFLGKKQIVNNKSNQNRILIKKQNKKTVIIQKNIETKSNNFFKDHLKSPIQNS